MINRGPGRGLVPIRAVRRMALSDDGIIGGACLSRPRPTAHRTNGFSSLVRATPRAVENGEGVVAS
jgi:hypothetical protein